MKKISLISLIAISSLLPLLSVSSSILSSDSQEVNQISNSSEEKFKKAALVVVDPKSGSVIETFNFDNEEDFNNFSLDKELSID